MPLRLDIYYNFVIMVIMSIEAIRKVVKVGSSGMVSVPAKEMKHLGITYGDKLKVTYELVDQPSKEQIELVALTQKLIKRHQTALKNLSQR